MGRVKKKLRSYDSRSRLEQARRTREGIVDAARQEFLKTGYATTTIAIIARKAAVSVESVYKGFGGKAGLLRAIHERGLAGSGPVPAEERSDAMSARETDPRRIIRNWGAFVAEVSPLVSPILLLVRTAAAGDAELARLLERCDEQRLVRMRHNAQVLADRGFLAGGMTIERAADIMWAQTSPEQYELFVVRRGWTPAQLGDLVATTLIAVLLPPRS